MSIGLTFHRHLYQSSHNTRCLSATPDSCHSLFLQTLCNGHVLVPLLFGNKRSAHLVTPVNAIWNVSKHALLRESAWLEHTSDMLQAFQELNYCTSYSSSVPHSIKELKATFGYKYTIATSTLSDFLKTALYHISGVEWNHVTVETTMLWSACTEALTFWHCFTAQSHYISYQHDPVQVWLEQGQYDLSLGIPKSAVEFQDFGAIFR